MSKSNSRRLAWNRIHKARYARLRKKNPPDAAGQHVCVPVCYGKDILQMRTAVPGASNRLYKSMRVSKHFLNGRDRAKPDLGGVADRV